MHNIFFIIIIYLFILIVFFFCCKIFTLMDEIFLSMVCLWDLYSLKSLNPLLK